jgi:hypothetical protein
MPSEPSEHPESSEDLAQQEPGEPSTEPEPEPQSLDDLPQNQPVEPEGMTPLGKAEPEAGAMFDPENTVELREGEEQSMAPESLESIDLADEPIVVEHDSDDE